MFPNSVTHAITRLVAPLKHRMVGTPLVCYRKEPSNVPIPYFPTAAQQKEKEELQLRLKQRARNVR